MKQAAWLIARFVLTLALIACLWITSTTFRVGPFLYDGVIPSDYILWAASLALLTGLVGLYRSGAISTVIACLISVIVITAVDHLWGVLGYFDDYKGVQFHVFRPAIAAILIAPLAFLFRGRKEAGSIALACCWAALIVTMALIGGHVFRLRDVIGPTYIATVFLCLLVPEILRHFRRRMADDEG